MGSKKVLSGLNIYAPSQSDPLVSSTMSGTATIYSQVINVTNLDNLGLEIKWTGTPTGTITVLACNDNSFPPNGYSSQNPIPSQNAITFNPVLSQPAGSASGYLVSLAGFPWLYYQVKYTNSSGSGVLSIYASGKDLN